jgi:hypothetical protein
MGMSKSACASEPPSPKSESTQVPAVSASQKVKSPSPKHGSSDINSLLFTGGINEGIPNMVTTIWVHGGFLL